MMMIKELNADDVFAEKDKYILVDVRETFELSGPEGCIPGSLPAPLGTEFMSFLESASPDQSYVFICKGGYRSLHACEIAHAYGLSHVYNLKGGMLAWNTRFKTPAHPQT